MTLNSSCICASSSSSYLSFALILGPSLCMYHSAFSWFNSLTSYSFSSRISRSHISSADFSSLFLCPFECTSIMYCSRWHLRSFCALFSPSRSFHRWRQLATSLAPRVRPNVLIACFLRCLISSQRSSCRADETLKRRASVGWNRSKDR